MPRIPLLFVLPALMAACSGDPRPVPLANGLVDAFTDGNTLNVFQLPWDAISEGQGSRAAAISEPGGFGATSLYHLVVSGVRQEGVVGVRTRITQMPPVADPTRAERPRDASAFQGLALAMRGTPGTYIVQLGTAAVDDFDYYNAYVEVTGEWNEFRIPFSAFSQEGFGEVRRFTGTDIVHIAVYANLAGYFEFGLDDVVFYSD